MNQGQADRKSFERTIGKPKRLELRILRGVEEKSTKKLRMRAEQPSGKAGGKLSDSPNRGALMERRLR